MGTLEVALGYVGGCARVRQRVWCMIGHDVIMIEWSSYHSETFPSILPPRHANGAFDKE